MSFDAFMYVPGENKLAGETQDDDMSKEKAFEILSFEIGAENNINIGSISAGGGAGKATFKELIITKKTDTASCGLFSKLCEGGHLDDVHIVLRRSGGAAGKSGVTFLQFVLRQKTDEGVVAPIRARASRKDREVSSLKGQWVTNGWFRNTKYARALEIGILVAPLA